MPLRPEDNPKPFKKGDPRINRKGRPKKLPKLDVLISNVLADDENGLTAAESILIKLKKMAMSGNIKAAEILLDRAYGKPRQKFEHTGKDENPISIKQEEEIKGLWFFQPAVEILRELKKNYEDGVQPNDKAT